MDQSIASNASHTSQLDEYLSRQGFFAASSDFAPPVPKALALPIESTSTISLYSNTLDSLLNTPKQPHQSNLLSMVDDSFGVTSTAKKRAKAGSAAKSIHSKSLVKPTLDSYLGNDDSDEDESECDASSDLSVSDESYRALNESARKKGASYSKRVIEDVTRRRLDLPADKLHSASLIPMVETSYPSNADTIQSQAMVHLASSEYGPVVRSSILAKNPLLSGDTDPDSILRRMRDQHNLRKRR